MMKRETLLNYRRTISKFDHYTSVQMERQLIDSHLEALEQIDTLRAAVLELEQPHCDFDCDGCRGDEDE